MNKKLYKVEWDANEQKWVVKDQNGVQKGPALHNKDIAEQMADKFNEDGS